MTGLQAICMLMIRLWAAGVIISFLSGHIYWFLSALIGESEQELTGPILEGAIWIMAAVAGFFLAPQLARLIAPRAAAENVQITVGVPEFVVAGSFLIGVFFLVRTAPSFVVALADIIGSFALRESDAPPPNLLYQGKQLLSATLTVAVALFLTVRPSAIAKMFASLRHAGLAKVDGAD